MLTLNAEAFYRAAVALNTFHQLAQHEPDQKAVIQDHGLVKMLSSHAKTLLGELQALETEISTIALLRLMADLKQEGVTWQHAVEGIWEVNSRLRDELSLRTVFCLGNDEAKYFDFSEPAFGADVADRLPTAIPDIEDAGKCIALMQGTASVFHSMRVMEAGLKALGRLLDIPYAPSWESYISQIEAKITAKHKTKSVSWKRDEPFYREVLGNLQTIKIAWRNPTMHIVRRYSVNEAEEIYVAVRAFLKRLAPRLPKPKPTKTSSGGA